MNIPITIHKSLILILLTSMLLFAIDDIEPPTFTPQEKEFIRQHPTIVLGSDERWEPFVKVDKDGKVSGYDQEILQIISQMTGIQFTLKVGDWKDMVALAQEKKIDGLSTSAIHKERGSYLNFSQHYYSMQRMVITSKTNPKKIYTLKDLDGKKIAIQKSTLIDIKAAKRFKNSTIVEFDNMKWVIESVVTGRTDAMFGNGATQYFARKLGFPYLQMTVSLDSSVELVFSVRNDWSEAISIINKSLDAIGAKRLQEIRDRWFLLPETEDKKKTKLNELNFSIEELSYMHNKKEIKMCVDPNWLPLEKIEDGKYIGLGSEYMKRLEDAIDIHITLVPTKRWSKSLSNAKNRVCDILAMAAKTPSREEYMDFTTPYVKVPIVIATKTGFPFIENIEEVLDKKLGVVRDYSFYEKLKTLYPSINLVPVDSPIDGIQKVKDGKIFGYLDNHLVINALIQKKFMGAIAISGKLHQNIELGIASRNDEKLLGEILKKFIQSIGTEKKQALYEKWISFSYKEKIDYTLLYWVLTISFLILTGTLYWNRRLKVEIRRRRRAEEELNIVNSTLESKVEEAVDEIHNKEILLQHQSRLAQMGEMMGMIAHQWRQPLSAVSAAIFTMESKLVLKKFDLQESDEREKFEKYLKSNFAFIQEHTQTMSDTIDDFRNFFKDETDQKSTTVSDIAKKALEMIRPLLENQEIYIEEKLESREHIALYRNEVIQVILNLLKNAQDALMDHNILERKITIHTYDTPNSSTIKICDNAGGVDKDIAEKIFDPYFSTKLEQNGTGLGLYMSKMIIEEHHQGSIELKSMENGSCFVIEFFAEDRSSL